MKITVLSENTTARPLYRPEFGLSLHIQCGSRSILFDAGCTGNFARNAEALGVNIAQVDTAVLSHGHFDHANGFAEFLKLNDHAPIYAHAGFDGEHYRAPREYIGIAPELKGNPRFAEVAGRAELGDGLTLLGFDGAQPAHPLAAEGMLELVDGTMQPDGFSHEHYLLVCEGDVRLLVTGCSHRGIANIMHWAREEHVTHVVGGFHLSGVAPGDFAGIDDIAGELLGYGAEYFTGHCTGIEQYARLKAAMGSRVSYLGTGRVIEL